MTSAAKLVKVSPSVIVSFSMYLSVFFLPIIFRGLSVNLLFFFFFFFPQPFSLELGGKSPITVFDDVEIDKG